MIPKPQTSLYEKTFYSNAGNLPLLSWLKEQDKVVLDIGCGAGDNARILCERGVKVHGLTLSSQEAKAAAPYMTRVQVADVSTWVPDYPAAMFDAILMSHVVEHLPDPVTTLKALRDLLKPTGTLYMATPNIAFWRERLSLLRGTFNYEDTGTRDKTHLRFFTFHSITRTIEQAGYKIKNREALGHIPFGPLRKFLPRPTGILDRSACRVFPNFFGYQVLLSAVKLTD